MGFNLIATSNAGLPAFLQEVGGYQDEGLSAGIQARAPKIGITIDKHFTLTKDGQTIILQQELTDAAGNKVAMPVNSLRVIIVAASQTLTKAWYEQSYTPGSTEAPDCYSNDGKVPAPGVAKPQCANCAQCPKNAFGSNPVTGRGKACADRKMIVCVWEGAPDELMTWNVPTMSLQSLSKFDSELRNANIPMQSVLVELFFDQSIQYPVVKINALGFVDKETTVRWKEASQSTEVMSLLREVDYEPVAAASPVPANTIKFGETTGGAATAGAATGTAGTGGADGGAASNTANAQQSTNVGASGGQTPAPEPRKRTRRTKEQIEADRLAAAAAGNTQTVDIKQEEPVVEQQQQTATVVDPAVAAMQAQLAALTAQLAAAQQTTVQTAAVEQATVNTTQTTVTPEPTVQQTEPAGTGNVAALLQRWKTTPA